MRLIFKYPTHQVNVEEIKKHRIKHVISADIHDETILLDIHLNNEEGLGWTEGEGLLSGLLPLSLTEKRMQ
ncbi:MAG: hypothetical protein K0R24_2189 [Gammaproteobacteria bacterium]|nr:hypothetical protein [Gammaproteobacteria bacterium]